MSTTDKEPIWTVKFILVIIMAMFSGLAAQLTYPLVARFSLTLGSGHYSGRNDRRTNVFVCMPLCVLSFACLPLCVLSLFLCLFCCLSVGLVLSFVVACTHLECMYTLGVRAQLPRHNLERAKNANKKTQAQKGQCSVD